MKRQDVAFAAGAIVVLLMGFGAVHAVANPYFFFAGYVIVQYVVLATAWNILGGYAGYINFGPAALYGAGVYTSALLLKAFGAPLVVNIVAAGLVGMVLGLMMGYLTLRVQGVYFAIATIALVIMLETVVHNIEYLGGARGLALIAPEPPAWAVGRTQFVFLVLLAIAVMSVALARWIERSWIGRGLRALRASEEAAECAGVATLRLKLAACAVSGALLAVAGAPYIYYASYIDPGSAFSLTLGLNTIAMPLIGGTRSWAGPVIGALLLASVQQAATVTISSELNVLMVGLALIVFIAAAPDGLIGLAERLRRKMHA
ncbi:MAG: branched-chain amino acid ABC transporter permease [Alphaproteobacteria bacterium]|nr:branched-chain amino acid ABC transporter permease [Alphaproteobacteria bacterium]